MSAVPAVLALAGRNTPETIARAAWQELADAHLVAVAEDRIVLLLPACDVVLPAREDATSGSPPNTDADSRRALSKRLAARWSRLKLDTVDARLAWLASPEGLAVCEALGLPLDDARSLAEGAGQRRGTFGRDRDPRMHRTSNGASSAGDRCQQTASNGASAGTANGASNGASGGFPPAPPFREKAERNQTDGAAEQTVPAVPANGASNHTTNGASAGTESGATEVRCPTVERTGQKLPAVEAREVFAHLRGGVKLEGGGLTLSTTKDHEKELNTIFKGFEEDRAPWSVESVRRLARHIGKGHLRDGWRPQLSHLRGKDATWTTLLSLHDEAQTCERCAPRPPVTHKPISKSVEPPVKPQISPDEAEEVRRLGMQFIEELKQKEAKK
jgi:hypothetical protein